MINSLILVFLISISTCGLLSSSPLVSSLHSSRATTTKGTCKWKVNVLLWVNPYQERWDVHHLPTNPANPKSHNQKVILQKLNFILKWIDFKIQKRRLINLHSVLAKQMILVLAIENWNWIFPNLLDLILVYHMTWKTCLVSFWERLWKQLMIY